MNPNDIPHMMEMLRYKYFFLTSNVLLRSFVGTNGANLGHFLTVYNLVKFSNVGKCFRIYKYNALDHPSVLLKLVIYSHRGNAIIFPHPIFPHRCNLSHFGLFVLESTCFLQSFLGYGSKPKIWYFVLRCTGNLHRNNLREDNN